MNKLCLSSILFISIFVASCATTDKSNKYSNYKQIIEETWETSNRMRQEALNKFIAMDPAGKKIFPPAKWQGVGWELVAFHLNEKTDLANDRLLKEAKKYTAKINSGDFGENTKNFGNKLIYQPAGQDQRPFNFFTGPEYMQILYKYGSEGLVERGRLKPETEAAMKEYMWLVISQQSKLKEAGLDRLLTYQATENHDILRRPVFYLMNYLYMKDPLYNKRQYKHGGTAKEHFEAYNKYFLERPGARSISGHWAEAGSDTYQKYTPPMILTMAEIAPDPLVRKRYKMLLDVIFVVDAQFSVEGRRGGGRARAYWGKNSFEATKNILFGISKGSGIGSTHNKIFETSSYQMPESAVLLRKVEFPAEKPFEIINRSLAEEMKVNHDGNDGHSVSYEKNGRNINYAYRTPHYIIGGMMYDLTLTKNRNGVLFPKYSQITLQNRWSGVIFDHPDTKAPDLKKNISAIYPEISKHNKNKGRPQNGIWGVHHKNVMIVQRIPPVKDSRIGSYNSGQLSIVFAGEKLEKTEKEGWIFASDGKAYAAVKFLDSGYIWNNNKTQASQDNYTLHDNPRVLIQAGDIQSYISLDNFITEILKNELSVEKNKVTYYSLKEKTKLVKFTFDPKNHKDFFMPMINDKVVNLRPEWTYKSPYVNSKFEEKKVTVTVGPITEVYDFGTE